MTIVAGIGCFACDMNDRCCDAGIMLLSFSPNTNIISNGNSVLWLYFWKGQQPEWLLGKRKLKKKFNRYCLITHSLDQKLFCTVVQCLVISFSILVGIRFFPFDFDSTNQYFVFFPCTVAKLFICLFSFQKLLMQLRIRKKLYQ